MRLNMFKLFGKEERASFLPGKLSPFRVDDSIESLAKLDTVTFTRFPC